MIKDSPADKAGLKDGDIVTKVGGVAIGAGGGISSLVSEYAPGETIEVTVLRDGKEMLVRVTLAAYKA